MSPKEIKFCHDTCQTARGLGIGIREGRASDLVGYLWMLPSGKTVSGALCKTKETALLAACRQLAIHLTGL